MYKSQHREFEPPDELRNTIKCFWYERRDFEGLKSSFDVTPDGYTEIIFHFGGGCALSLEDELRLLPSPFLIGLLNQPVVFHTKGHLEIIGIRCFPWTVFNLLGIPSDKDGILEFEHPVSHLHGVLERCISTGKIEEAMDHLKVYFLSSKSQVAVDSMLSKAGTVMRETNGNMPVNQVAEAAHATVRTLERNFKQSSDHTVKDVSGLIRFEKVRNKLLLNPDTNLAGLAYELGYADQSHLSREFKRYSGSSPAAFARNAKKFPMINEIIAFKKTDDHAQE